MGDALEREPSFPASVGFFLQRASHHSQTNSFENLPVTCAASVFLSVKNMTDFKPQKVKPLLRSLRSSHGKQENNALHL